MPTALANFEPEAMHNESQILHLRVALWLNSAGNSQTSSDDIISWELGNKP